MGKENESTMTYKVEISNLTKSMQEAKRSISMANAEFKNATAGMKKWSDTATGVEAKIAQLNKTSTQQEKILADLKKQYDLTAKEYGENSIECEKLRIKIENQSATIGKTKRQISEFQTQLSQMKKVEQESQSPLSQLNSKIQEQENKLSSLKRQYQNAVLEFGKGSKEAKTLAKDIGKLSSELNENKMKLYDTSKSADKLDKSLDKAGESATSAANGGFTVLKGAMANLVSNGINLIISGLKNIARETIKTGMDFESGMSKVGAVSGASADDLKKLTDKAKEMGAKTKFSATESAEAFNYMAMAGWKTEEMLGGVEGVMNLAAASGSDLATTSDIVTDALTAMGYTAKDAGQLADVMAAASSNANTNVEMMGQTFQYAAPIVGALGYSMEDTALAIGLMANSGIKGEKAGTALRSVLTRLSAPPAECANAMKELGVAITNADGTMRPFRDVMQDLRAKFNGLNESQQTNIAKSIAGQEAMSGLLAIVNSTDNDFNKLASAVDNSSGAAQRMADTMNNNVQGSLTLLKSQIEGKMIQVFEKLSPYIRKAVDEFGKFIDGLDWDKIADSIAKLGKHLLNLAKFLLQNAGAIAKFVLAFLAINTAIKITKNLTAAHSDLSNVLSKSKTVMGLFTGATKLSSISMSGWVGGIGLAIAGVTALISFMTRQRQKMIEAREAAYKATEEYKRNAAALNDMSEMTEKATGYLDIFKTASDDLTHIEFNADYAKNLADEIYNLSDKTNKSKEEITLLNAKVEEFNSLGLGNVQIEFDETGQHVKSTREEMVQLIDAYKKTAEITAVNNLMRESSENLLKANSDLSAAEKNRARIQDDLNAKTQRKLELEKLIRDTEAQAGGKEKQKSKELGEYKEALEQVNSEIATLQGQEADATTKIGEATTAVEDAKTKQAEWAEAIRIANAEGITVVEAQQRIQDSYNSTSTAISTATLTSTLSFDDFVNKTHEMVNGASGEFNVLKDVANQKINEVAEKVRNGQLSEEDGRKAISGYVDGFKSKLETLKNSTSKIMRDVASLALSVSGAPSVGLDAFNIGQHATGGVFRKPTLGIIGEDGGEVVMPLEKNTGWINVLASKLLAGMGGSTRTTNVSTSKSQNITFNQTINSPKAVDRLEVYKQTNNLLFNAKVGLRNV